MASKTDRTPRDIWDILTLSAYRYGTKTALRDKKNGVYQDISYVRFKSEADALALMLQGRFPKGERVLILGNSSYEWALSFFALVRIGAVPVPVDPALRGRELSDIARKADACGILYGSEARSKRKVLTGLRAVCFDKYPALIALGQDHMYGDGVRFEPPVSDPEALAVLFFTPGTTGEPKGVMLSHRNILATVEHISDMMQVDTEDTFLSYLPLSHTYECVCGFLYPLYRGAAVAFSEGLPHILQNLREIHPSCMVTIPLVAEALYHKCWARIRARREETRVRRLIAISDPVRPLSVRQALKERVLATERAYFGGALKRLLVLGEAMDVAVQKGLRQLGVFTVQGYGITECAGLAALNRDDFYRDGAVGFAFGEGMLDIYNRQPDGSGEIRYRGKNVMLGYWQDAARTDKALVNGWYHTGDMGYMDSEGFLYLRGRRQNCIEKKGGQLICPEYLERLICQSLWVKDAVVVGDLNEEGEAYAAAVILPDYEYAASVFGHRCGRGEAEMAIDEWVAQLNGELHVYQQIGAYAIAEKPFPKDSGGRVKRAAVAAAFAAARAE